MPSSFTRPVIRPPPWRTWEQPRRPALRESTRHRARQAPSLAALSRRDPAGAVSSSYRPLGPGLPSGLRQQRSGRHTHHRRHQHQRPQQHPIPPRHSQAYRSTPIPGPVQPPHGFIAPLTGPREAACTAPYLAGIERAGPCASTQPAQSGHGTGTGARESAIGCDFTPR